MENQAGEHLKGRGGRTSGGVLGEENLEGETATWGPDIAQAWVWVELSPQKERVSSPRFLGTWPDLDMVFTDVIK